MSKGKYERSLTLFTALKYLFPKDQNTLFYSGLVYYKNGDFGYAMHCWARLLAIENSLTNPLYFNVSFNLVSP